MATAPVELEQEVDPKTAVYTKEELDELRRKLRKRLSGILEAEPPGPEEEMQPPEWRMDLDLIVKFLRALEKILTLLIQNRIPDPTRQLLRTAMQDTSKKIDDTIQQLLGIASEQDTVYVDLQKEELAGSPGALAKFIGFFENITGNSVIAVLDSANNLLGSLLKVFPVLGPVKEMKDVVKEKIKYGADQEIITTLGLTVDKPIV